MASASDNRRAQRQLAKSLAQQRTTGKRQSLLGNIKQPIQRAVERGATRGQMQAYGKSVNAIVTAGAGVEVVTIGNVPRHQRQVLAIHRSLVNDVIAGKPGAEKKLQKFVRQHPTTGGDNPRELASDIDDILDAYEAEPDDFSMEDLYPEDE